MAVRTPARRLTGAMALASALTRLSELLARRAYAATKARADGVMLYLENGNIVA